MDFRCAKNIIHIFGLVGFGWVGLCCMFRDMDIPL